MEPESTFGQDETANPMMEFGKVAKRLIEAAEKDREPFIKQGKEVEEFSYGDHDKQYAEFGSELFFKAKVPKTSEFLEIMQPYLLPDRPTLDVTPRDHVDLWGRRRLDLEAKYADYSFVEGDLYSHLRSAVAQALTYGRGVLWTTFNKNKKIVQNVFGCVSELLLDPDARANEDIHWGGRKRRKPRWELRQLLPDAADIIDRLPPCDKTPRTGAADKASELVEYYIIYSRVGLHNYASSNSILGQAAMNDDPAMAEMMAGLTDDSPRRYIVSDGKILAVEPWEIPLFLDDMWPWETLDLRDRPGHLWPVSPLEPGLGYLKAMDWAMTFAMSRMRITSRTPIVVANYNGQGIDDTELVKLLQGEVFDVLRIRINGNEYKIGDLVQQFKLDSGVPELVNFFDLMNREFAKAVGLYEILYAGDTSTQIRTATDAEMKDKRSRGRIDDMVGQTYRFLSRVSRKTLLAARFLHPPEDLARLFGKSAGALWGTLAPPEVVEKEREVRAQMIARQTDMMRQAALLSPPVGATGLPMPPPPVPTPEQVDDLLGPPQFVNMEEWIHEAGREVEAGSMRRLDHSTQIDNLNVALNQLAPSVVALPNGPKFIAALAEEFAEINRFSPRMKDAAKALADIPPPMPPMPPGGDAGPGGPPPAKPPQTGPQGGA